MYKGQKPPNACSVGAVSAVFSFTTLNAPGACESGAAPIVIYKSNFDGPQAADGWTATTVIAVSYTHLTLPTSDLV